MMTADRRLGKEEKATNVLDGGCLRCVTRDCV